VKEGDEISLDGSTGEVVLGRVELKAAEPPPEFHTVLKWADEIRKGKLAVRANADNGPDAANARQFGAEGIGLCRTEHMFLAPDRLPIVRDMILANTPKQEARALERLRVAQQADFEEILAAMDGLPVTVRLLDPPLHEFLPQDDASQKEMADTMGVSVDEIKDKVAQLHELNPMLGHRGCRLSLTYPEICEMQVSAIIGAACAVKKDGVDVRPEIMIPLTGTQRELADLRKLTIAVAEKTMAEAGLKVDYLVGTMIEIPRAALTADLIAAEAEFFSFGTNDLTQLVFGFSRDDAGKFLSVYQEKKILDRDPFQSIDTVGVGGVVAIAVEKGKKTRPSIKLGVCGEHGGDPSSIHFFHKVGLNYVSASPYRIPVARLAAAQAAMQVKVGD